MAYTIRRESAFPGCTDAIYSILCREPRSKVETVCWPVARHELEQSECAILRASMVSVCAFLSIWQHEWDLQDETSLLKSFPCLPNISNHIPHRWHFSWHCLTLKTAVCTGRSAVMCRFDPVTMWTWRMSRACGSASTPEPRTWTMSLSLVFVVFSRSFVEA